MLSFPNCKINIGLYITNRRCDGYHDLISWMIPINWCDILEIVPTHSGGTSIKVSGNPIECSEKDNLVWKAHRAVESFIGKNLPVEIYLRKIIPDKAGLGGGSADASFCIKTLNDLYTLNLEPEEMMALAAQVGSDCPFFIKNKPAIITGKGDVFEEYCCRQIVGHHIVIVKPHQTISTKEAYSGIIPCNPEHDLKEALERPLTEWKNIIFNDFEKVVFKKHPELKAVKESFYEAGAYYASMSGSGSAFYGIFSHVTDNMSLLIKTFENNSLTVHKALINF